MEERVTTIDIDYEARYPELHRLLESRRFVVGVAHRRFGKTTLAVYHLLKMASLSKARLPMFGYVCPFRNQAKTNAWAMLKELARPIPGRKVNESELSITLPHNGARVRIFGSDNPDALRGMYFDGVVIDEVAQAKPGVWEEIIQPALADRHGWAFFIGTPKGVNIFSELYVAASRRQEAGDAEWGAFCFRVDQTKALPEAEIRRLKSEMSDAAWRQEFLCDFNASSEDSLITLDDVDAAVAAVVDPELVAPYPIIVGVDVARYGDDASVIFPRQGRVAHMPRVFHGLSNTHLTQQILKYMEQHRPALVCVDQGQGTGVIDLLRDLADGQTKIIEVPFGSAANAKDRFVNRRAEMWTAIRDWLRTGGQLPDDQALREELTSPTYDYDAQGRIRLEKKEDIKKRLRGRSTDRADALALTFAVPQSWGLDREPVDRYGRELVPAANWWEGVPLPRHQREYWETQNAL